VQLYGRIHSDICIVPLYLVPGVRMQIKLTKAKPVFKFLDAELLVNHVRPSAIAFHRKRRVGNYPKTTPIHHGEEHGNSRLSDDEHVHFRHYDLSHSC